MSDDTPKGLSVRIRIPRPLYETTLADLARPHRFAAERVGFLFGRLGNSGTQTPLILLHDYQAVEDERYVDDPGAGARIDGAALRSVMQTLLDRGGADGAFHVHVHDHDGPTWLSPMDWREQPRLVPGFRGCAPRGAHGIVVLSRDHGLAQVWLPSSVRIEETPLRAERITVVGAPLAIFDGHESEEAERAWMSRRSGDYDSDRVAESCEAGKGYGGEDDAQ